MLRDWRFSKKTTRATHRTQTPSLGPQCLSPAHHTSAGAWTRNLTPVSHAATPSPKPPAETLWWPQQPSRGLRSPRGASAAEHEALRVLAELLDALERGDGFSAVDEPVVVRHRDVHHRPDDHLPLDGDGPREDAMHAEDG